MKSKKLFLTFIFLTLFLAMGSTYVVQEIIHQPYAILRAEASEDTAVVIATAGAFASKPSAAVQLKTATGNSTANTIQITVIGGDAANDTFSWRIYAWRASNGPAELVADGNGILGTQQVVTYPQGGTATSKFWVDSFTIAAQYRLTTVTTSTTGGNSVASLWIDTIGYEWWYIEITDADGSSTQAESLTAYYSYF